jgi:uncharacterized repeat protein (TIGR03806 family)
LIPYDVISPLWSDGAEKSRWMALPEGATVAIGPDGDFDYPNGTVLMKLFRMGERRVETRLLMRHDDGSWAGYSYAWNDEQTDATLLASAKTSSFGDQIWSFPSRSQCLQCHTKAAGGALGPETAQLNRDFEYASTDRIAPELATLEHIGVFASPPPTDPLTLPDPMGTAPVEDRARAYLHANCAHCHRPGGGGQGTMDLRFAVPLRDTMTCNAEPTQGGVGPPDAKLIVPGSPEKSILSLRMHQQTSKFMPPIAVRTPDPAGLALVDAWIRELKTCP